MKKLLLAILSGLAIPLYAATYYVDFDGGSDAAAGTSTGTAWKHCRGDANATGTAGTGSLAAGDTVNFKGGVNYYGKIDTAAGTLGNQLIYQGDSAVHGWGSGKAIINGTVAVSLSVCTGNGTGAGQVPNANYASIYVGTIPSTADFLAPVVENNVGLVMSSFQPSNPYPFFWNNSDYFYGRSSGVAATSIVDSTNLTQSDSAYWVGARVLVSLAGAQGSAEITGFNPDTDTITFPSVGTPYQDGAFNNQYHYGIVNSPRLISGAGQFAIDATNDLIYVWPLADHATVRIGSLDGAFNIGGNSYVTIDGFETVGQYGGYNTGRVVRTTNSTGQNGIVLKNCKFTNAGDNLSGQCSGSTYIRGGGTTLSVVQDCIYEYLHGRGAFVTGVLTGVERCEFRYVSGTTIYTQNFADEPNTDGFMRDNYIHHCFGVHANGITVYGAAGGPNREARRWVISGNRVFGYIQRQGPGGITAQGFHDLEISNNIIEADQGCPIDGPSPGSNYVRIVGNTVVVPVATQGNASAGVIRLYGSANTTTIDFRNNICHGFVIAAVGSGSAIDWSNVTHTNNIFTALTSAQTAPNGWSLGTGESTSTAAALFTSPGSSDFTLKTGSLAIDAGTPLSSYYTDDVLGVTRPQGAAWDIGAYEYADSPPTTGRSRPSTKTRKLLLR
jgi:hypothetical protein